MQVKEKSIILNNVYVVYNYKKDSQFVSLKNFNYQFDKNKIYCIIGESGSGKSTLISLFNGLTRSTYGDISINEIDIKCKKYLHNIFLAKYKLSNDQFSKLSKNTNVSKKDHFYIFQCPKDSKYCDVKVMSDIINNHSSDFFIKKINQNKLGISQKVNNNFFLVKVINPEKVDDIKDIKNLDEIKTINVKLKSPNAPRNKKIKNYKKLRREIGMVAQFPEFQLFKSTVIEDVMFGPRILGFNKKEAYKQSVHELNKLGIYESHFNNSPFELSGGQKRRVAIAGILAIKCNTLIFDEPTAGLDPVGEAEMVKLMLDAKKQGMTVFVVTHSMEQVLEIADEILVIHDGELIAHGDPYDIFNNKKVLECTNIEIPFVVKTVNKLVKTNHKYKKLLELKPRTVESLSENICKINKVKGGKK